MIMQLSVTFSMGYLPLPVPRMDPTGRIINVWMVCVKSHREFVICLGLWEALHFILCWHHIHHNIITVKLLSTRAFLRL